MSDWRQPEKVYTREEVLVELVALTERMLERDRIALRLIVMETTRPGRTVDAVKTLNAIQAIAEEALR